MKTEFALPDFTYLPIVASMEGILPDRPPLFLIPEKHISQCTKERAICWVQEFDELETEKLAAIYCYEGGKLFDASSEIAKAWIAQGAEGLMESAFEPDSYKFPKFVRDHAGKEIDEFISEWNESIREGESQLREQQSYYNATRGVHTGHRDRD